MFETGGWRTGGDLGDMSVSLPLEAGCGLEAEAFAGAHDRPLEAWSRKRWQAHLGSLAETQAF